MTPRLVLGVLLVAASSAACATASLDRRELRGDDELGHTVRDVPVHGFQVAAETTGGSVEGELVAVDEDAIWIAPASERVVPIPRAAIISVRVQANETFGAEYGGWVTAGTLSTLTHGLLLVISAPAWLLVGIPTSVLDTASGRGNVDGRGLDALYQYARFPQGPPPALTGERPAEPIAPPPPTPFAPLPVPDGPPLEVPPVPPEYLAPAPPPAPTGP